MSYCDMCKEYAECTHPVDFHADPDDPETPEEIKQYIGLGHYIDDAESSFAAEDFWENCAHVCHECFPKYSRWISWSG